MRQKAYPLRRASDGASVRSPPPVSIGTSHGFRSMPRVLLGTDQRSGSTPARYLLLDERRQSAPLIALFRMSGTPVRIAFHRYRRWTHPDGRGSSVFPEFRRDVSIESGSDIFRKSRPTRPTRSPSSRTEPDESRGRYAPSSRSSFLTYDYYYIAADKNI